MDYCDRCKIKTQDRYHIYYSRMRLPNCKQIDVSSN